MVVMNCFNIILMNCLLNSMILSTNRMMRGVSVIPMIRIIPIIPINLLLLQREVTKRVYFIGNERMLIAHDSNRLRFG